MIATFPDKIVMGHAVLELVGARGGRCTVAALRAGAEELFGRDATFVNCQGARFSFDELLDFLVAAGKLSRRGDQLGLGAHVCESPRHDRSPRALALAH